MVRWKTLESKLVFEHPRLTLLEDTVVLPDGKTTNYLRHGPHKDYPTIIPVDEHGKFILIEEHAYPINKTILQFPEGDAHEGETVEATAHRELLEETGLKAGKLTVLGFDWRDHRRSTTKNMIVLAEELTAGEDIGHDPEEIDIKVHKFTESEVWEKISVGDINQKNTLAAWAIYQATQRTHLN